MIYKCTLLFSAFSFSFLYFANVSVILNEYKWKLNKHKIEYERPDNRDCMFVKCNNCGARKLYDKKSTIARARARLIEWHNGENSQIPASRERWGGAEHVCERFINFITSSVKYLQVRDCTRYEQWPRELEHGRRDKLKSFAQLQNMNELQSYNM